MSPEAIISILARLNGLLEEKYKEQNRKYKKFKQLQMILGTLSFSVAIVLFVLYHAPLLQMLFIMIAFNFLFFIGFRPRAVYDEKKVKLMMKKVVDLQISLKKFIMGEETSFDGVKCSMNEGWICDKWGLHRDNERIDYGEFLYDKHIKGLYLDAIRNKK